MKAITAWTIIKEHWAREHLPKSWMISFRDLKRLHRNEVIDGVLYNGQSYEHLIAQETLERKWELACGCKLCVREPSGIAKEWSKQFMNAVFEIAMGECKSINMATNK